MTSNAQRAEILVQALPYIQQYNGQIVVIKYGGNAMIDEGLKHAVMRDIVLLSLVGIKVVLLHGGGPEITECCRRLFVVSPGDSERSDYPRRYRYCCRHRRRPFLRRSGDTQIDSISAGRTASEPCKRFLCK